MILRPNFVIASILVLLAACSGFRPRARTGEGVRLTVPYFSDRREQWAPAALADVLSFWNRPADLKELRREIQFTKGPKAVAVDLQNAARNRGLAAEMVSGDLPTIKRELDAGRPVLALVNLGYSWVPVRSYVVIVGYSDLRKGVYAHWGPNKDFYVSYRQFKADWEKADRWFLRVSEAKTTAQAEPPPPVAPPPALVCPPVPAVKRSRSRAPRACAPAEKDLKSAVNEFNGRAIGRKANPQAL